MSHYVCIGLIFFNFFDSINALSCHFGVEFRESPRSVWRTWFKYEHIQSLLLTYGKPFIA